MIEFVHVSGGYDGEAVLKDISFRVLRGGVTALIGPNGSGKSTLLRMAARLIQPESGRILVDGQDARSYTRIAYAKKVSMLAQTRDIPSFTVRALTAHGRYPHLPFPRRMSKRDWEIVDEALRRTGAHELAERNLRELSGGEMQKAYFAMNLAQDCEALLLDEPSAFLDAARQFELLDTLKDLSRAGKAVLVVMHSLSCALEYADNVAVLQNGTLLECLPPNQIPLELLQSVFGVRICRAHTEDNENHFIVLPMS